MVKTSLIKWHLYRLVGGRYECKYNDCRFIGDKRSLIDEHVTKHGFFVFPKAVGEYKKGDAIRFPRRRFGYYPCLHDGCEVKLQTRLLWVEHMRTEHVVEDRVINLKDDDSINDIEVDEQEEQENNNSIPFKYLTNPTISSVIEQLDIDDYSKILSGLNEEMILKYRSVCNYYFQSGYNNLFISNHVTMTRGILFKHGRRQKWLIQPLRTSSILLNYKDIFIKWILFIIGLKEIFELGPFQDYYEKLEKIVRKVNILSDEEVIAQENEYSYPEDFDNRGWSNGNNSDKSFPWIGAHKLKGMKQAIECLHELLLKLLADDDRMLTIALVSFTILLIDEVDSDWVITSWRSPIEAKKVAEGILYSIRMIFFHELELTKASKSTIAYLKTFFNPETGRFIKPFNEIRDSIDNEISEESEEAE